MKSLRTAVIGLGRVGWGYHIPQVAKHEGFELTAVVDPIQDRLEEAQEVHGARGYVDCESLLESEEEPNTPTVAASLAAQPRLSGWNQHAKFCIMSVLRARNVRIVTTDPAKVLTASFTGGNETWS